MEARPKKILILYTSVGLGHKSIAENLGTRFRSNGFTVMLADVLKLQQGVLTNWGTRLHQAVNRRMPAVWSWAYQSRLLHALTMPFRVPAAASNYDATLRLIKEYGPDIIITTQTTASAVVAYLVRKQLFHGQFGIAFSDFHLHPYWLYSEAHFYIANTDEQARDMEGLNIPTETIFVCGITLKPPFFVDRAAVRSALGIGADERVVLVSAGSLGVGLNRTALRTLVDRVSARVVVVCGKNEALRRELSQNLPRPKAVVLGFYAPMEELYSIADLYITKPGGLSVAESLQNRLPIIVTHILPGQEELNLAYLLERGLVAHAARDLAGQVAAEMETRSLRKSLEASPVVADIISGKDWPRLLQMLGGSY